MNIAYITAQLPYGKGEQFIIPEIIGLVNQDHYVKVFPIRPEKNLGKGEGQKIIADYTDCTSIYNIKVLLISLWQILLHPIKFIFLMYKIFAYSNGIKKILKNLVIIPKAFYIAHICKKEKIEHIHAHWASTSATAGYIVSYVTNISWSFTSHRWDIYENNMISEKFRTAKFVRVINKKGYKDILKYTRDEDADKCHIIHVGIDVDNDKIEKVYKEKDEFNIAVPANLLEVKGHKYLIEAIAMLKFKGISIKCYFYGDGQLKEELGKMIKELKVEDEAKLFGSIAHNELLNLYKTGFISAVILPSINTDKGEHEGIPVSLMEAMANKVPVISTNTGGIPELLESNCGIIVEEKNPKQLAEAIQKLMSDKELRETLTILGFEKVNNEFNNKKVVKDLISLFQ